MKTIVNRKPAEILDFLKVHRPDLLKKRIPVGITEDGRRLDHSCGTRVRVGPKKDSAIFPLIEAACLMWHLRHDPKRLRFRAPPLGRGGNSRVSIVRFEWVTLGEFLGLRSGPLAA
ncbi:hypothetical protein AA309_12025 [Microvirga vignae]|uniref:Uncharacterized protein n=1 Tax=Microvirga vignae TaxID=1225564 RepID=A0A0H1RDE0_9HYPH|nr:hypothetical protein [Microvirga vignae]KLK92846.1 hypothetical protein AA309_12025 [Microvirga vignae]